MFSAALAPLLAVTVLDLKPNPQDATAFYLENLYRLQFLADSNASLPSTLAQLTPFSAPKYVVWVNLLWSLSLSISLTCAMFATRQQRWAYQYRRLTQLPRPTLHDQVRTREYYASSADVVQLSKEVERLWILMQISLSLFFSGLLVYLFSINHTVFFVVVSWVAVSAVRYLFITFVPIFRLRGPRDSWVSLIIGLFGGIEQMAEETVKNSSTKFDDRILDRLFKSLVKDSDLVRFFEGLPGFCRSSVVKDPLRRVANLGREKLDDAVQTLFDSIWPSHSLTALERMRRLVVCVNVVDAVCFPDAAFSILKEIFPWDKYQVLQSVEMPQLLRSQGQRNQKIGDRKSVV